MGEGRGHIYSFFFFLSFTGILYFYRQYYIKGDKKSIWDFSVIFGYYVSIMLADMERGERQEQSRKRGQKGESKIAT